MVSVRPGPALMIGLAVVGLVSALTAQYATTSEHVIGARALMGLGAALVMPATLAIIVVVFPPEERGKAVGIWVGMAGIGAPIGLLVGGWAVENFDWRMVFWINPLERTVSTDQLEVEHLGEHEGEHHEERQADGD